MKSLIRLSYLVMSVALSANPALARTLVLEGNLESRIALSQQISFSVDRPLERLEFRFALPAQFKNRGVTQQLDNLEVTFSPKPASVTDETDKFGNKIKNVTWRNLTGDARVGLAFIAGVKAGLPAMESKAPFPLTGIPKEEARYLQPTGMVQSDNSEIRSLATELTARATSEYAAITAVLNHVSDNVKYTYNPPKYDALHTLRTGSGNCQNFAHLAMALLRSAGIPARIVGGISLKEQWKIPLDNKSFLAQSMGQGGHAWIEIYFPDLGWLSYDPQQSRQFTSSRHIKQTHGLDSHDINDSWRGTPYVPAYSEQIDAKFLDDNIALKLKGSADLPKTYQMANSLVAKAAAPVVVEKPKTPEPSPPVVVEKPKTPEPPPPVVAAKPKPPAPVSPKEKKREFGNVEFPNFVNAYQVSGDTGVKILDKETAEYVTSRHVYAQAFIIAEPLRLDTVSLAMRKFGGDGSVYVDLVADDHGKPGLPGAVFGIRSLPSYLDRITRKPGYYWVDFKFPGGEGPLKPGKYWIVLRHSGEAIMNWFFTPGKHYGDPDDTRSTTKGYQWEDILNYDFVFRVRGTAG